MGWPEGGLHPTLALSIPSPSPGVTAPVSSAQSTSFPACQTHLGRSQSPHALPQSGVAADAPSPPRRALLGQHYTETHYSADGSEITETPDTQVRAGSGQSSFPPLWVQPPHLCSLSWQDHCFYQGRVRGHPGSAASISTCGGLRYGLGSLEPCGGLGDSAQPRLTAAWARVTEHW